MKKNKDRLFNELSNEELISIFGGSKVVTIYVYENGKYVRMNIYS